ncbi:type IV toxin-antitoxin system AbiEi family antitoxin domain-containing protein [Microbacter sp. GSS18]|nr:type IV toxin-antitoxin system AbiEi family antitoxin domain-containing protein [Microbacter sp. GSS18]
MFAPSTQAPLILPATTMRPSDLAEEGIDRRQAARLVDCGELLRLRKGRYARADIHPALSDAGRLGGRLDCVSLLAAIGVFVRRRHGLHLQLTPGTTRLPARPADAVVHWRESCAAPAALAADLVEALAQAVRCQEPRDAIATLDSAWHHGLVDEAGIASVFARLPRRYHPLRALLDRRSESGAESIMRLMLRSLGASVELQVVVPGVGRVDVVVDGWLIIECDSQAHHDGWDAHKRYRRRDIHAAELGYTRSVRSPKTSSTGARPSWRA